MICQRSGYCCIHYDVIVVDDPEIGIDENNLIHKPSGVPCKHLIGDTAGQYSCSIHDKPWYPETPCFAHTQVENGNTKCRIGEYSMKNTLRISDYDHIPDYDVF